MNEIESFFQELTTKQSTPLNSIWTSTESTLDATISIESLDTFDFDSFSFDTGNPDVIDPSIFNFSPTDSGPENEDYDGTGEDHAIASVFCFMHLNNTNNSNCSSSSSKSVSARRQSNMRNKFNDNDYNLDSSSSSSSTRPKTPKFYSRSGQVADPSRGPCHNCHTTLTCYWRKLKGQYHCNACTLFFKRNKYHRSGESVAEKPIKRRNRKSKYSTEQ